MKKTISINIAATAFYIDEDAYERLQQYLKKLEAWFNGKEGGQEIITDIENRLSELFSQRINPKTGVITVAMAEEVIAIMGQPEDFSPQAGAEPEDSTEAGEKETYQNYARRRRLYRDLDNKVLGGVCSGIAAYFNIDPVLVRVIFAILPFLSFGVIIPIYIILWIAMPAAITAAQKLEMRGENINVSNIEKVIKEQYHNVKDKFENFTKKNDTLNRMSQRDRNVLIFTAILVGILVLGRIINNVTPFLGMSLVHFPFGHIIWPGFFPLMIILLILGLIFRSAMKGFLIAILILFVLTLFLKITGFAAGFPWMITCW